MSFQFDTLGVVDAAPGQHIRLGGQMFLSVGWAALDPFMQGYTEGVCRAAEDTLGGFTISGVRFSDLAHATVQRIIDDCASIQNLAGGKARSAQDGRNFWAGRNAAVARGAVATAFPPQTAYLGDDGKVYLRDAA